MGTQEGRPIHEAYREERSRLFERAPKSTCFSHLSVGGRLEGIDDGDGPRPRCYGRGFGLIQANRDRIERTERSHPLVFSPPGVERHRPGFLGALEQLRREVGGSRSAGRFEFLAGLLEEFRGRAFAQQQNPRHDESDGGKADGES